MMPMCCDCFRLKPWYFELNGPVCEGSVSNLSSNPLKLLPRTMFVKWWQHAKSHPFWRSFELIFNSKAIKLKKYALKLPNEVKNVWNFSMLVWMLNVDHIKSLGRKRIKNNVIHLWCDCLSSKPQYFEMNGPVCEGSVSNLSSNPLKLLSQTM